MSEDRGQDSTQIFDRLMLMFRRSTVLPQLPDSALRLMKAVDGEYVSSAILERIVTVDPALAGALIRIATSPMFGGGREAGSVRGALLHLGAKNVRSIALSLAMQSIVRNGLRSHSFDPERASKHAVFVALLASALHSKFAKGGLITPALSSEEVLSSGLLHELHYGILARVAPQIFECIASRAQGARSTYRQAFTDLFDSNVNELGAAAFKAWGMPAHFGVLLLWLTEEPLDPGQMLTTCCFHSAERLARVRGFTFESWEVEDPYCDEQADSLGLDEDDLSTFADSAESEMHTYLEAATMVAA